MTKIVKLVGVLLALLLMMPSVLILRLVDREACLKVAKTNGELYAEVTSQVLKRT